MHRLQLGYYIDTVFEKKCDDVSGFQEEHSTHTDMLAHNLILHIKLRLLKGRKDRK